ncbi:PREDICTED: protein NETWORKED 3A-like [Prunus mume]|uniref:Protein NETWORKED 3A-like n=1 Tax=Prunus mume TaxID=102107 RepID=A0ABM0P6B0_PRUMU|nr:PREDICTED: protein NETWORKED 3A-like [Prunus mume]XP_008234987.1 PREDICTED: protein NETWORKED 3A-like [Prunus mume]
MTRQQTTHWWLYDSHCNSRRSPWLQTTLADLEHKTEDILKLIQEDADSFAQRAEMYYKKRPQLISMVEEFYRAHRSLAERYDQLKSDPGTRLLTTLGSPFSSSKCQSEKSMSVVDLNFDSHSETCEPEEYSESEVDDPELDDETQVDEEMKEKASGGVSDDEVRKLREVIEKLEEENRTQKDQIKQKDEEKREVIRQLSLAVDMLKEENVELRKKCLARESPKNSSPSEGNKFTGTFLRKLFNRSPKFHPTIVAL